ncbi:pirin family protein [Hymenobacter cellulosilyticus]|uniref:Pirin family protein n=1 Tax=Hymenobacter cellulosilyticus TaxID=2932248 RepID=A0A8T9Q7B1_9BACT|nr:pirin family protein [Hymenobacter cellulosilyticus]UOQ71389.1 pirin family protein [Hymenobacter cellulosilyticus]
MSLKPVRRRIVAEPLEQEYLTTYQPLPSRFAEQLDPFLLLHHTGPEALEPAGRGLPFAPHPHRGFETVTFVFAGDVRHHDSRGNSGVVGAGGVQWMTAGLGIVHSENISRELREAGGTIEYVQLWINLPARLKRTQPRYQGVTTEQVPEVELADGRSRVRVVAGSLLGTTGPVDSLTGIQAVVLELAAEGQFQTTVEPGRTVLLYVLRGNLTVNGRGVGSRTLVEFEPEGTAIDLQATEAATVLYCTGQPYHEPLVWQGPYVMNTQTEIMEAMRDYQMGRMGMLFDE